jgi:hypothetical protein
MDWAKEVMKVKPELEEIAGRDVRLDPLNWGNSVSCRVEGRDDAAKVIATRYRDPNDGGWYELRSDIYEHLTPEQIDSLETKHLSIVEAQEALREYVRTVATPPPSKRKDQ